ncbi:MAG: tetratricopeptide repeat protein, partial [Longimicrobiales bacterium]
RLGESLSQIRSDFVALPNATTSSLEALRYWVQSDSLWTAGQFAEAATLLNLAIEEDSAFALAHSSLALYHFFNNRRDEGESHLQRAMADVGRLAVHERLWIEAQARSLRGDQRGAISLYRAYLDRDSTDRDAWYNLAKAHERLHECDEAVALYHKVLRLDPGNAGAYINIATCQNNLGKWTDAIASYERAFTLQPDWVTAYYLNHEYGNAFVALGSYDSAAVIFGKMLDDPDAMDQARGHRSLGLLEMARGRYSDAAEHLQRAAQLNSAMGAALSEYRDRLHLAVVQDARGQQDAAHREIQRAYALAQASRFEPGFLAYGGRLLARAGRTKQAESLLEQIAERGYDNAADGAAHAFVKGEIALARGEHEAALEALGRAHDLDPQNHYYLASLADAYRAVGRLDDAFAAYDEVVQATPHGWEAQHPAALALLESGRILELRGDTAGAIAAYRALSDAWAGGQDDLSMLVETRTRLARLAGS